jgi:hypothetical protein
MLSAKTQSATITLTAGMAHFLSLGGLSRRAGHLL